MEAVHIDPDDIVNRADAMSYSRGERYALEGRVRIEERTSHRVRATVSGSSLYSVVLDGDSWTCDCPVGIDGTCCKHCVAVAITIVDEDIATAAEDSGRDDTGEDDDGPALGSMELADERLAELSRRIAAKRATSRRRSSAADPIVPYLESLPHGELVDLLLSAVATSDVFASRVVAAAALASGDVTAIKQTVRGLLPSRRFLDWRASTAYARDAREVVPMLGQLVDGGHATAAIPLIEDAFGRLNRRLRHADDSGGAIGDLCHQLLALHVRACTVGRPDPRKLAKWLVAVGVDDDYGYFNPLVDEYAPALGAKGVAAYRAAIDDRWANGVRDFGVLYAKERLARLDRDVPALVDIFTEKDRGTPNYYGLAETLFAIGLPDDGLHWAERGIAANGAHPYRSPYDLAVAERMRRGETEEAIRLRREALQRAPSAASYSALRETAEQVGVWPGERDAAIEVLRKRSVAELVDALLEEDAADEAWEAAQRQPLPGRSWQALAEVRQLTHPLDAIPIFEDGIRETLVHADRRNYQHAAQRLVKLQKVCASAGEDERFSSFVALLREENRRRPTFAKELQRARIP